MKGMTNRACLDAAMIAMLLAGADAVAADKANDSIFTWDGGGVVRIDTEGGNVVIDKPVPHGHPEHAFTHVKVGAPGAGATLTVAGGGEFLCRLSMTNGQGHLVVSGGLLNVRNGLFVTGEGSTVEVGSASADTAPIFLVGGEFELSESATFKGHASVQHIYSHGNGSLRIDGAKINVIGGNLSLFFRTAENNQLTNSTLNYTLDTAGASPMRFSHTVNIKGSRFNLTLAKGYTHKPGSAFTILEANDGIHNSFENVADGDRIAAGNHEFIADYTGAGAFQLTAVTPSRGKALVQRAKSTDREDPDSVIAPRAKYLLLDARLIASTENAALKIGTIGKHPANPLFGEDKPWEKDLSHMYAAVIHDREEKIYKCWYDSFVTPECRDHINIEPVNDRYHRTAKLYATSRDGIHWKKPELDVYTHDGKPTNIVCMEGHGLGVFKDDRETDPARRYKMIRLAETGTRRRLETAFSADGIHWSEPRDTKVSLTGDTHNNAFWDPIGERYVAISRGWSGAMMGYDLPDYKYHSQYWNWGQRIVARTESPDFEHWAPPTEILPRADRNQQVYAMPVFHTDGVFLGLPVIFDTETHRMWPELAWSPDTRTWHWIDQNKHLIPLAEDRDSHEWGCIFAADAPIVREDEIRIYYSGQPGKHGWNPGYLCLATLRPDGWAGYEPQDAAKPATVRTKPLTCTGGTLTLTADAERGSIRATVFDADGNVLGQSKPLSGSVTAAPVSWQGGFDPDAWKGKPIRLAFAIKDAKLYAFSLRAESGAPTVSTSPLPLPSRGESR